ncbi:hypothetical protein K3M67_02885 [Sphingobium sp. V4]|uniref:hypothetical protein n=1 Tax=Sphingobium sp. V4 TaxID=3038927 RepID=UPI0025580F32|nr:hypothetical protein [Sphingobium sp. V4]WIW88941.1 hypothetical protein K3M67_02885 [Sphingobium sp. V4]
MEDHLKAAAEISKLTDAQLVARWNAIEDPDNLTVEQQAIIDEMARREIDF